MLREHHWSIITKFSGSQYPSKNTAELHTESIMPQNSMFPSPSRHSQAATMVPPGFRMFLPPRTRESQGHNCHERPYYHGFAQKAM
jgi:hypothetical protein